MILGTCATLAWAPSEGIVVRVSVHAPAIPMEP
jgi:hypothetical protein